jgi:hypothetical protein
VLNGAAVPVLSLLNQKDHHKRDDRRAGINDQLSRIAVSEQRAGDHSMIVGKATTKAHGCPMAVAQCFVNRAKQARNPLACFTCLLVMIVALPAACSEPAVE